MRDTMVALLLVAAALLWFGVSEAQNPNTRGVQVTGEMIAPSTVTFDTTITTTAAMDDTIYLGFFADYVSGESYTAACSLGWRHDPLLVTQYAAGADTSRDLRITSSRGAVNSVPLISLEMFVVGAGSSFSFPDRISAIRVLGQAGAADGTLHIHAGGSAYPNWRY